MRQHPSPFDKTGSIFPHKVKAVNKWKLYITKPMLSYQPHVHCISTWKSLIAHMAIWYWTTDCHINVDVIHESDKVLQLLLYPLRLTIACISKTNLQNDISDIREQIIDEIQWFINVPYSNTGTLLELIQIRIKSITPKIHWRLKKLCHLNCKYEMRSFNHWELL